MKWMQLDHWLPCLFCTQSRATHHRLCLDCWQSIRWDLTPRTRQDVSFIASCFYEYPLNHVVHGFKEQSQMYYLPLLIACLKQLPKPNAQAIVPMPISTEKLIKRGFSQTYLLAQALSKHWNLPIWQPIHREYGKSQRLKDRVERLDSLSDELYITVPPKKNYKKIVMLDDVITTGASLAALQEKLKELGCTDLQAMCICNVEP